MEFRKATAADTDMLVLLRLEMIREENQLGQNAPLPADLSGLCRRYFLEGDQTTVIASDTGTIIACASLCFIEYLPSWSHPTGKRAHLMNVYTRPGFRGKGVASRLVRMLIDEARARQVTEISLDTTGPGRNVYTTLGFQDSEECMVMLLSYDNNGGHGPEQSGGGRNVC